MGKKNRARLERPARDQESPDPISTQGWKIIGAGVATIIAGFVVLGRVDPLGRNWAAVVSPLLILGGYGVVAIGIFWTQEPAAAGPPSSSSGPVRTS